MADNTPVTVAKGGTYRNNNTEELVVAFFVDRPASTVRFSPATGATGREDRASIEDFLRDYTLVANQGEEVEELTEGEPKEASTDPVVNRSTTTIEQQRLADNVEAGAPKTTSRK